MATFTLIEGTIMIKSDNAIVEFSYELKESVEFLKKISSGKDANYTLEAQNSCVELDYAAGILVVECANYNCRDGFLSTVVKIDISTIVEQFANVDEWPHLQI